MLGTNIVAVVQESFEFEGRSVARNRRRSVADANGFGVGFAVLGIDINCDGPHWPLVPQRDGA